MNQKYLLMGAASVVIAALIGLGLYLQNRTSAAAPEAKTAAPSRVAPQTPAHEIAALEEQLKKNPKHSPILLRLAELEGANGRMPLAVKYLREAAAAEPANNEIRLELGRILYQSGDIPGAIKETSKILDANPHDADALYNLGAMYGNQGDEAKATEYFNRTVAASPASASAQKAKAGLAMLARPTALPSNAQLPPGHPKIGPQQQQVHEAASK